MDNNNSGKFYAERADQLWDNGDYNAAIEAISQAIESTSDNFSYYLTRINYLLEVKRYDDAIYDLTIVIEQDPFETYYARRAMAYKLKGDLESSLSDYNSAILLTADDSTMYILSRANVYLELQEYELAIKDYNSLIEFDSGSLFFYFNRAKALVKMDRVEDAVKDFHTIIELSGGTGEDAETAKYWIQKYSN